MASRFTLGRRIRKHMGLPSLLALSLLFFLFHFYRFSNSHPGANLLTDSPTTSILNVLSAEAFIRQFKRWYTMGELLCASRFPSRNTFLTGLSTRLGCVTT